MEVDLPIAMLATELQASALEISEQKCETRRVNDMGGGLLVWQAPQFP